MGDPGREGAPGASRPLWAGGFAGAPDPGMWAYTSSLAVDRRLWRQDVAGSRAHVRGLVGAGVLELGEGKLLLDGLARVAGELAAGRFAFRGGDEDVHSAVERRLTELAGPVGGKLHTGRSRNDQVATDLHLWLKEACADAVEALAGLVGVLVRAGRANPDAVVPGLTHLQPAQPVLWAFQLAAHGFALARDIGRFQDAGRRADVSPLGAGAIAGSSFPLDPAATAATLGFAAAFDNAMDATADRDAVAELLAAAGIAMVHASRLAEDVALWAGRGWVRLPDAWATGSSMLPQKRNPDVAELVRGRTGTVLGRLAGFLTTLKGLPLAYARDLQEDKAAAFDLAEALVRDGVAFREAHTCVGAAVRLAATRGTRLADLSDGDLAAIHPALAAADRSVLSIDGSLAAKATPGSTNPARVGEQLTRLQGAASAARSWATGFRPVLDLGLD
jgi:argininosuccinate lyase